MDVNTLIYQEVKKDWSKGFKVLVRESVFLMGGLQKIGS